MTPRSITAATTTVGTAARPGLALPLALVLLVLVATSLALGPDGFGLPASREAAALVLTEIRLPRTLLAAVIGAGLATAGAALQGYLRNPLAEPGLIGVTGGASLGAVLAVHSGASTVLAMALPIGGLVGAALATCAVMALARPAGGPIGLILAGVAISSIAGALTSLALNLAPNPFASIEIVFWLLGSLSDRSLVHLWLAAPLIFAGITLLWRAGADLDALTLGEDAARNLGVEPRRLALTIVAGSALAVGAGTAVAGAIGFVGLVVPHLLRRSAGAAPSRLLPLAALGGAALVLAGDIAVRLLAPIGDLRLGVLTALIGAPMFLSLALAASRGADR